MHYFHRPSLGELNSIGLRLVASLFLLLAFNLNALAQQPAPRDESQLPLSQRSRVTLADLNIEIGVDRRLIVMMAALNLAGYDYEPGNRPLSTLRQQVREDLKNTDPALLGKLRDHFLAHRKGKTDAAAVAPYLSLALAMAELPGFSIETDPERLPQDVQEILDFALLLEEFYRATNFSRLLPKYVTHYEKAAQDYVLATAQAVKAVISYLHTEPILELAPLYAPRPRAKPGEKKEPALRLPMRERRFIVVPDLLNATGAANLRVIRDTYFLLLGPASEHSPDAARRAFLRFVIDPLTERRVKEVAAIREPLKKLLETRGDKVDPEYKESAYHLITDSLVRAADARMMVLGMATRRKYEEEDAIYDLSIAYERGAVLVFHFYDQISAFERVGINLQDYFTALLEKIDFEREEKRLDEYAQRLARYKQARFELINTSPPPTMISDADEQIVARILEADQLIKERKYADARAILETVRKERPNNARALFGLAEVGSKQASLITDPDQLEVELYAAVEFYRLAARNASPETEKWLAQRSYVAAGKILDFLGHHEDAAAAFDLAIKLGDVPQGAYQEALKVKQQLEQKPKP
jgi:hypothetical protein